MGWMGPHRNLSLRQKLRLIGIAASTTATVLTCVIFLQQEVRDFGPDVVRRLSSLAEIVGANSTAALVFGDPEAAEEILAGLVSQPSIHSACLYGPDGEPFATFVRPGSDRRFRPPGVRILTIRRLTPAEPFRDVAALTGALRVWSVPRVRGSPRRGKFVGLVRSPRSRIAPVRHVRRFLPFPTFADRPGEARSSVSSLPHVRGSPSPVDHRLR